MDSFETNRFNIKILENKYINNVFNILSDEDVITNLNMNIHKSVEDTEKLFNEYENGYKEKEEYPFEILDKETNDFIGVFLLKRDLYTEDCFEFTIYLNKKYWSKGVYTEVLPYMTNFVFNSIKVKNFRGYVKDKNIASKKVLEKCGFKLEKIFNVPGIEGKIYSYLKENNI